MRIPKLVSSVTAHNRHVSRRLRRLGWVFAAGVLFQAGSGGCEAQLSQALQTIVQDFGQGVGKGITSIGEAFLLNLFI